MPERESATTRFFGLFGNKKPQMKPWDEARQREAAEGMALLAQRRRLEQDHHALTRIIALWPLGLGIVLAGFSPILRIAAEGAGPWAMTLLFPFVVLAERPEMHAGTITRFLPSFMLYAQFPIEGLLARVILRKPVLPISVIAQVLLFHFLGIMEVCLLNGTAQMILRR